MPPASWPMASILLACCVARTDSGEASLERDFPLFKRPGRGDFFAAFTLARVRGFSLTTKFVGTEYLIQNVRVDRTAGRGSSCANAKILCADRTNLFRRTRAVNGKQRCK